MVSHKMGGRGQPRFLSEEEERELTEQVSTGRFRTAGEIRGWIEAGRVYTLVSMLGC